MHIKAGFIMERDGMPFIALSDKFFSEELDWRVGDFVDFYMDGERLVVKRIADGKIDYEDEFRRLIPQLEPQKGYF